MDEVIADPMGEMIDWYYREYGVEADKTKMNGSWLPGFPEHHQPMVMERLKAPGFFRNLPVMPDAVDTLRRLNEQYEVFIVSAAMEFPNSLTWKQIALTGSKDLVFGDFMIDDHVKNLKGFRGKPYLYTAAHNLTVTGYDRIDNWKQAADIFLK
jgi:5'(3')-deoxyribonucleotidase